MPDTVSDTCLSRLSEFVATHMGLHFPPPRWADLQRGVRSAAPEFGFDDIEACILWLTSSPLTKHQIEILASHLTVGETYFFREKKSLGVLETHILPELIRSRRQKSGGERHLRIWSAGCCTGEEPYSVAMLLSQMLPDWQKWQISILATDINPQFLRKAAAGVYRSWSFRDTSQQIKEKYFKQTPEGDFEIVPQIKKMVTFFHLNLVEDAYPSLSNNTNAMDVILCRNVLMYLVAEQTEKVLRHFYRAIVEGGWLIVSPSETPLLSSSEFTTVHFPGAILHRKTSGKENGKGIRSRMVGEAANSFPSHLSSLSTPPHGILSLPQSTPPPASWSQKTEKTASPIEQLKAEPAADRMLHRAADESYQQALSLFDQGRYNEAVEKLTVLLSGTALNSRQEATSRQVEVMDLLAHACANGGELTEALAWCDKAIDADKMRAGIHYLRATILQEQDHYDEAVASLRRAIYLDPNFVVAHFALGNLARRQGKLKEAEKHFANALLLARGYSQDDFLPESEGITAGRLSDIISSMSWRETLP